MSSVVTTSIWLSAILLASGCFLLWLSGSLEHRRSLPTAVIYLIVQGALLAALGAMLGQITHLWILSWGKSATPSEAISTEDGHESTRKETE